MSVLKLAVEVAQEVDRDLRAPIDGLEIAREQRAWRLGFEIGAQLFLDDGIVGERPVLGFFGNEEVERIDDRHVGDEIDRDGEDIGFLGQYDARQKIAERILLPIDESASWARA